MTDVVDQISHRILPWLVRYPEPEAVLVCGQVTQIGHEYRELASDSQCRPLQMNGCEHF